MDAYVLGAGFSKAVDCAMPVMENLLEPLRATVEKHRPDLIVDDRLPIENVESFLDFLATEQPFLETPENLSNRSLFGRVADWLREEIYRCQRVAQQGRTPPPWLVQLIEIWHHHDSAVVTLNYDTLVEAALHNMNLKSGTETVYAPDLYPMPIPSAEARIWGQVFPSRPPLPAFRLIKLHGSLNWFYPGASGFGQPVVDVNISPWNGNNPPAWSLVRERAPKWEALIVPPSLVKNAYFQNDTVRGLWLTARDELEAAERVFLLGYSLPSADGPMRALLSQTTRGKQVVPVNVDSEIISHYKEMLPGATIDPCFVGDSDAIKQFVHELAQVG